MNIFCFDSEEAWCRGVVTFWRDRLRLNPRLRHCLPSGNTPKMIYAAIVEAVRQETVSLAEAEIFALDEYGGLATDDPGRCANMLRRFLLDGIGVRNFRCLDPDAADLESHCRNYEAAIAPGFDLVLLGVGLNGHLGLNEPGSAPDTPTRRVEMHAASVQAATQYLSHDATPTWGLTVGLKALLASKEIWLLANGTAKASIVRRLARGVPDVSVPASLLQRHPNCSLFVDAEAGREL